MSKYQPNPRHSLTRGAAAARALNATRTPSPLAVARVKAVTVEMGEQEERDIIARPGQSGVLYLVRSSLVPTHYFAVTCRDGVYSYDVDDTTGAQLVKRIKAYIQELAAA